MSVFWALSGAAVELLACFEAPPPVFEPSPHELRGEGGLLATLDRPQQLVGELAADGPQCGSVSHIARLSSLLVQHVVEHAERGCVRAGLVSQPVARGSLTRCELSRLAAPRKHRADPAPVREVMNRVGDVAGCWRHLSLA